MPELPIEEDVEMLENGFWYYAPEGCIGVFSVENLRQIAKQLDEMNRKWEEKL